MELSAQYQLNLLTPASAPIVCGVLLQAQLGPSMGLVMNDQATLQWALTNWLTLGTWWGIFKHHQLVGVVALMPAGDQWELSYGLLPVARHQGVMTQAVKYVVTQTTGQSLVAQTTLSNQASQRILLAAGFSYDEQSQLWTCN